MSKILDMYTKKQKLTPKVLVYMRSTLASSFYLSTNEGGPRFGTRPNRGITPSSFKRLVKIFPKLAERKDYNERFFDRTTRKEIKS